MTQLQNCDLLLNSASFPTSTYYLFRGHVTGDFKSPSTFCPRHVLLFVSSPFLFSHINLSAFHEFLDFFRCSLSGACMSRHKSSLKVSIMFHFMQQVIQSFMFERCEMVFHVDSHTLSISKERRKNTNRIFLFVIYIYLNSRLVSGVSHINVNVYLSYCTQIFVLFQKVLFQESL